VNGHLVQIGSPKMMRTIGLDFGPSEVVMARLGALGATSLLLAIDGVVSAVIGCADAVRPESAEVVRALQANGRREVIMLSGDARAPVEAIARQLGVTNAIAEVLPENKADVIRRLKSEGRKVAMVGDGINDAPALAVADIGISLRGGTEVALETADVVLLEGGLERLPEVFALSERAMRRVKQVVGLVLAPNGIAIAAGAFGLLNPITASIVNNGSTIAAALHAVSPILRRNKAQ
jgi:Cu2+-exporting ATPase